MIVPWLIDASQTHGTPAILSVDAAQGPRGVTIPTSLKAKAKAGMSLRLLVSRQTGVDRLRSVTKAGVNRLSRRGAFANPEGLASVATVPAAGSAVESTFGRPHEGGRISLRAGGTRRSATRLSNGGRLSRHPAPRNDMAIKELLDRFKKGLAKTAQLFRHCLVQPQGGSVVP